MGVYKLSLVNLSPYQLEGEEGDLAVVLLVSHVCAVDGSTLSVAIYVASHVCFLCVCLQVMHSASLSAEPENGKVPAMSISLQWRYLGL